MREARPLIKNALMGRGFDEADLDREIYRHIHQSSINVVNPRAAYKGVRKILWNEADRTFRVLSATEMAEIASGRLPQSVQASSSEEQAVTKKAQQIARESLVRDYIARNLDRIEGGLALWNSDYPAVEHPIANRRIDIFARDASNCPVIIELKLHRAHDRVVGQALLYRALVRKYYSVDRVRIILIAERISKELVMASQDVSDIEMFEYQDLRLEGEHEPNLKLMRTTRLASESSLELTESL